MVGVLRYGKGHEVLFQAIPQLKAAVPNVQIKLVGDGELEAQLREQAAPYADVIEFLGQRTDIPQLLSASDVLVLPSWSEALPTVLIEAGAASLPVVATQVGGIPEIVEEGKTGYIVPPGDPSALATRLIDLLQNPALARQMGQAAHTRVVQQFSLQRQALQTITLYKSILSQKKH
jgi:glycosyltransferase involved in cell wall biosynthesis